MTKIAICDYKEPLNRDLDLEREFFRKGLGDDTEVTVYEHHGDNEALKAGTPMACSPHIWNSPPT